MYGSGADVSNLVCVQTNKWDLPTTVNTNVRGALGGILEKIKVIIDNVGVYVIAITETVCTNNMPDGPLSLSGFNIYWRDR